MARNLYNELCHQCGAYVHAQHGVRLWADGGWQTFCQNCGEIRSQNKKKAAKKAAYRRSQPKLF